MAPRVQQPRSPRGRPAHLHLDDASPPSASPRPRSPFPAPVSAAPAAAVSHISVETATRLDKSPARPASALLTPPRPRLPASRSAPSIAGTSSSASGEILNATADSAELPHAEGVETQQSAGPSSTSAPSSSVILPISLPSHLPSAPHTPRTPRTPHTPRSRRVSLTSNTGSGSPLPIRTPSKKGKERAPEEVDTDVLGEVSCAGNARRGLRELVARDERRRERDRERERERPVASAKGVSPLPAVADIRRDGCDRAAGKWRGR